jgi:hypothetical protein
MMFGVITNMNFKLIRVYSVLFFCQCEWNLFRTTLSSFGFSEWAGSKEIAAFIAVFFIHFRPISGVKFHILPILIFNIRMNSLKKYVGFL